MWLLLALLCCSSMGIYGAAVCPTWPTLEVLEPDWEPGSSSAAARFLDAVGFWPDAASLTVTMKLVASDAAEGEDLALQEKASKAGEGRGWGIIVFLLVLAIVLPCTGLCGLCSLCCCCSRSYNGRPGPTSQETSVKMGIAGLLVVLSFVGICILGYYAASLASIAPKALTQVKNVGILANHAALHYGTCDTEFLHSFSEETQAGLRKVMSEASNEVGHTGTRVFNRIVEKINALLRADIDEHDIAAQTMELTVFGEVKSNIAKVRESTGVSASEFTGELVKFLDQPADPYSDIRNGVWAEMEPSLNEMSATLDEMVANITRAAQEYKDRKDKALVPVLIETMDDATLEHTKSFASLFGSVVCSSLSSFAIPAVIFMSATALAMVLGMSSSSSMQSGAGLLSRVGGVATWIMGFMPVGGLAVFLLLTLILSFPCRLLFHNPEATIAFLNHMGPNQTVERAGKAGGWAECVKNPDTPVMQLFPKMERPLVSVGSLALVAVVGEPMKKELEKALKETVIPGMQTSIEKEFFKGIIDYTGGTLEFFMDIKTQAGAITNTAKQRGDNAGAQSRNEAQEEALKQWTNQQRTLLGKAESSNETIWKAFHHEIDNLHIGALSDAIDTHLGEMAAKLVGLLMEHSPPCAPIRTLLGNTQSVVCGHLADAWVPLGILSVLLFPSIAAAFALGGLLKRKARTDPAVHPTPDTFTKAQEAQYT